jgi:HK97 family phage portal protein
MSKLQRLTITDVSQPSRIDRLRQAIDAFRSSWTGPITSNSPEFAKWWGTASVSSGVTVNEATALNYSAVWSAVQLISAQVGSLPLVLYRKKNDDKQRYDAHPLYRIVHDRSNPEMSAFIFRETLQAHVLLWGNAYAEIERDNANRPVALWPITPERVTPFRERYWDATVGDHRFGPLQYRVANPGGGDTILNAPNVIHIPGLGYNGTTGYSVISHARESIGLGIATERFGGTFFGNGSTFGGALEHPGTLTEPARKNLSESLQRQHQGVDRAHKFVILEEGMKYQKFGIPPNDAQFLETRTFQVGEIARWFNLPPHKLKELSRSTNNNIEQQNLEYYIDCIATWLERWEQELCEKLISPLERNTQEIEFVTEGLLRGDSASRGEFHSKQFSVAAITPNEIRRKENLNTVPGGDHSFVAMNLIPLALAVDYWQTAIDEKKANIKQMEAPPPPPPGPTDPNLQRQIDELTEERDTARRLTQEAEDARGVAVAELTAQLAEQARQAEASRVESARAHGAAMDAAHQRATLLGTAHDALAAAVGTHDAIVAELRTQIGALTADRQAGIDIALDARLKCAAAEQLYEATERARLALEGALATRSGEAAALQRRIDEAGVAVRAALVGRLGDVIQRESDRARYAQRSPEKLRTFISQFFNEDYGDWCRSVLRPSLRALVVCAGHTEPAEHLLDLMIRQHVEQSVRQLRVVADEHNEETLAPALEKLLRRWEADRAETIVNRVLREA